MTEQNSSNLAEFERRYREEYRPHYEKFASRLHTLLEQLINKAEISIDHIEYRVKSVESFLRKIEKNKFYDNPFEQIKDFVGIRIITYYQDDVERVTEMIRKEFVVDENLSGDKITELSAREFGYRSFHLKISLSAPRNTLQEWEPYAGLLAEIQVRSILQHVWAVIDHEIAYKGKSEPSRELERRLSRLSAKLEEADEEFMALRDMSESITKEGKNEIHQSTLTLPLNQHTLQEFVNHKLDLQEWEQYGVREGMEPSPQLISRNRSTGIEILLLTLQTIGISTIAEFKGLFHNFKKMTGHVRRFVDLLKSKGETVYAVPVDVLIILVSFSKPESISDEFDWGGKYTSFYIEALQEVCKELSKA